MVRPSQLPPVVTPQCAISASAAAASRPASDRTRANLIGGPDVEAPLLALAVGIERGGQAAVIGPKLPQHEVDGRHRDRRVALGAGGPVRLEVGVRQLRVVVQHLLEVRDQPALVGAVAGEAAAELVVDAAVGHAVQRAGHHGQQAGIAGAAPDAQQELQRHRRRELRRAAEAAVHGVEARAKPRGRPLQHLGAGIPLPGRDGDRLAQVPRQLGALRRRPPLGGRGTHRPPRRAPAGRPGRPWRSSGGK